MKTYDETFSSVMGKIDEYDMKKKKQRKNAAKIGVSAFAVCLLAGIAVFAFTHDPVQVPDSTDGEMITAPTQGSEMPVMPGGVTETPTEASDADVLWESTQPAVNEAETPTLVPAQGNEALPPAGSGAFVAVGDTDTPGTVDYITLISSYPGVWGKYRAPAKGEVVISLPLGAAMEEYGDDMVKYYVRIVLVGENTFSGEEEKNLLTAELERLSAYADGSSDVVGLNEEGQIGDDSNHIYTLFAHCSTDFIKNFPASEEYGYFLTLYDESGSEVK